jgi:hypothetical protein
VEVLLYPKSLLSIVSGAPSLIGTIEESHPAGRARDNRAGEGTGSGTRRTKEDRICLHQLMTLRCERSLKERKRYEIPTPFPSPEDWRDRLLIRRHGRGMSRSMDILRI